MTEYHLNLREELCTLQKSCPGCGMPSCTGHDLHHLFVRRIKRYDKLLWHSLNIALVCQSCHTGMGEKSNLNYSATVQKFRAGITPEEIEDWVANLPTKVPIRLPAFYYLAKEHHLEFIKMDEFEKPSW